MAPQCYIIRTLPVLLSMYAQLHVPAPSASHHHNFSSVKVYKNELLTEEKLHTSQNLPFCVKKWVIELQNRLNAPKELGLFLQPTLMHNSITACMSHYYPALNRCSVQLLMRARIPDAVFVQLFLLRMGMSRPETCRG